jgi:hypothetical protein
MSGGLSKDAAKRATQLANLKPNAHTSHGCYSIERLAPLTEKHEADLMADYPALDRRRRSILADRLARTELARDWMHEHGLVRNARGEVFPIVDRLEKWGSRCEDMLAQAEAERREAGRSDGRTLEHVQAEIAARRELSTGDEDGDNA